MEWGRAAGSGRLQGRARAEGLPARLYENVGATGHAGGGPPHAWAPRTVANSCRARASSSHTASMGSTTVMANRRTPLQQTEGWGGRVPCEEGLLVGIVTFCGVLCWPTCHSMCQAERHTDPAPLSLLRRAHALTRDPSCSSAPRAPRPQTSRGHRGRALADTWSVRT